MQSTIFQSCRDGATASWLLPVVFGGVNVSCSRTQNGGCRYRTPDLSLRSRRLYHSATALPRRTGKLSFVTDAAQGSILSVRMWQGSDHSSNVGGLLRYLWVTFNSASHHTLSEFNPLLSSGLFAVFIGLNYHEDNPNKVPNVLKAPNSLY